jgi:hypothetical protein
MLAQRKPRSVYVDAYMSPLEVNGVY